MHGTADESHRNLHAVHSGGAASAAAAAAAQRAAALAAQPLWQHALHSLATVALAAGASALLSRALHKEADKVQAGEELSWLSGLDEESQARPQRPVLGYASEAALLALHRPAAVFLPVVAAVVTLRSASELVEALLAHAGAGRQIPSWAASCAHQAGRALGSMDHLIRELSEVALITFIIWTALRLKDRLVKLLMEHSQAQHAASAAHGKANTLERVLLPLSALTSWLIVIFGGMTCLHVLGLNIAPLLTLGGVSGILVGLSAQSVMANMIAGINLFLSRPFVVGERVDISSSSGTKFATGYVEQVEPFYTILRSDTGLPVTIPNKALTEMIICNESRVARSRVVSTFSRPRQYLVMLHVRYADLEKIDDIVKSMRFHIESAAGVDQRLPHGAGLASLDNSVCHIFVLVHTLPPQSRDFAPFRQRLLLDLARIVHQHGAQLAFQTQVVNVPQLAGLGDVVQGMLGQAQQPAVAPNAQQQQDDMWLYNSIDN